MLLNWGPEQTTDKGVNGGAERLSECPGSYQM